MGVSDLSASHSQSPAPRYEIWKAFAKVDHVINLHIARRPIAPEPERMVDRLGTSLLNVCVCI